MMIAARSAMLMSKPKLPYDAEVEYVESTGAQYIDTGVVGGSETKVRIVAYSSNRTNFACLFGARHSPNNRPSFCVWQYGGFSAGSPQMRFDYNSSATDSALVAPGWVVNADNEIIKSGRDNYVNGVLVVQNANLSFSLQFPFYLFNVNTSGAASLYPFVGRVSAYQIWDADSALVRDFIPVRIGQVGYLYDRANPTGGPIGNGLYGNAADGQGGVTGFAQFGADK